MCTHKHIVYSLLLLYTHFLVFWSVDVCVCVCVCVCGQSCPTLCDPMDCSPPCSSVRGMFQARILDWVAISYSGRSSRPRDLTWVSCIGRQILYHCAIWEGLEPTSLCKTQNSGLRFKEEKPRDPINQPSRCNTQEGLLSVAQTGDSDLLGGRAPRTANWASFL